MVKNKTSIQIHGDLHGRTTWKERIDLSCDKIIFLGDYVDSFDLPDKQIIDNLINLINFKKENSDKVELLLGNHDLQYFFLSDKSYQCSGFRGSYADELHRLFTENKGLFKASHQEKKWLFTHAGLNRLFFKKLEQRLSGKIDFTGNYEEYLNEIFNNIPYYLSDVSYYRGGCNTWGGIFWQDIREYSKDSHIEGLSQIVGHQPIQEKIERHFGLDTVIWIDTESHPKPLDESTHVLILDNNQLV